MSLNIEADVASLIENSPDSPVGSQRTSVSSESITAYVRTSAVEYRRVLEPIEKSVTIILDWRPLRAILFPKRGTATVTHGQPTGISAIHRMVCT
jgi:hypothetical protein